jgi:predicted nucleotidyltransferase
MKAYNQLHEMLVVVARALGNDLLKEVAFLGGCTTGLLLTDKVSKEAVRYTDDVDLITHVIGFSGWFKFQNRIKERGFKESIEDNINCRMRLNDLIVDFMPDDEKILGYSNRWYGQALKEAKDYELQDNLTIQLVTPVFFIATKLEAYKGRGNNAPLQSRDIEDILNVFDGRAELVKEINQSSLNLRSYISKELVLLLEHPDFEYAVQSTAHGQRDREELIFKQLETVIKSPA